MSNKFYTTVNRYGNKIQVRGYEGTTRIKNTIDYKPTLYWEGSNSGSSPFRTLDDKIVEPKVFDSMRDAKEFVEKYNGLKTVYGTTNYVHQFIAHEYPGKIEFDPSLIRVHIIDIECSPEEGQSGFPHPDKAEHPITSIAIYDTKDDCYYCWACADWSREKSILDPNLKINFSWCGSETELLEKFIGFWHDEFTCPDIISGWNTRTFDIPYIVNRIHRVLGETWVKKLSPWKRIEEKMVSIRKKQVQTYEIAGIAHLDYLDLFQKFAYSYGPQESYRLDHIANVVLGERKLDYSEYGSLKNLYKENPQLYVDYNCIDVSLVKRMDDKIGLLGIAMSMVYRAGSTYNDVFGTTAIWDALIHRFLLEKNIVVPPNEKSFKRDFEGAYVKEPQVGMHDWVCSFDLARLYPSIIVQWNMSPETILYGEVEPGMNVDRALEGKLPSHKDKAMAITGQYFSKEKQGFLGQVIEQLNTDRDIAKKKMKEAKQLYELTDKSDKETLLKLERNIAHYSNAEQTVKIFSNSLYGSLGNAYFRHFVMEIAEAITVTGQYIIKAIERDMNLYLNNTLKTNKDYVIAGDTDSSYLALNDFILKFMPTEIDNNKKADFLDKVTKKIQVDVLDTLFERMNQDFNCYKLMLNMKREVIASRGIWTAKKRYILNVLDNEGVRYSKPKYKIMGIEAIKSSTPAPCRTAMKSLFDVILNESEENMRKFVKNFRSEFINLPPEDKAFPRSVSNVDKYMSKETIYVKGTPINSRAAILYNHLLEKHNLTNDYEKIYNGDRMKYIYLNPKNPTGSDIIGFKDILPKEFGLHQYIDNNTQFQKTFIDPVTLVLEAIDWSIEEKVSLDSFFSFQ